MNASELYALLSWLSPAFPVGGYTYSHGLEYAVEANLVSDETELFDWLEGVLRYGTGRVDGMLFCAAYHAAEDELPATIELASAMKGTRELSIESHSQGRAFLRTVESAWGFKVPGRWLAASDQTEVAIPYSVAVALVCRLKSISVESALLAYLHALASNIVSAALRLMPIGQTSGQIVLARMGAVVGEVVEDVLRTPFSELGSSTPMLDWDSMRHENQHTRLFRS